MDQQPSGNDRSAPRRATAGFAAAVGSSLWRLHYKLSRRDLAEMFLIRGFVFSYEAVRDWEAKLTPALTDETSPQAKGQSRPQLVRRRDERAP